MRREGTGLKRPIVRSKSNFGKGGVAVISIVARLVERRSSFVDNKRRKGIRERERERERAASPIKSLLYGEGKICMKLRKSVLTMPSI